MRKEFQVHMLREEGKIKAGAIANEYNRLADEITKIVGEGSPELTIAMRKLEESCFYAKKAMAQIAGNQEA